MIRLDFGLVALTLSIVLQLEWRLCNGSSKWQGNDKDIYNISDTNMAFNATNSHKQLFEILNIDDITDINQSNESENRMKRIVFPGTLWCGMDMQIIDKDDLGLFNDTDMCCRTLNFCPRGDAKPPTKPPPKPPAPPAPPAPAPPAVPPPAPAPPAVPPPAPAPAPAPALPPGPPGVSKLNSPPESSETPSTAIDLMKTIESHPTHSVVKSQIGPKPLSQLPPLSNPLPGSILKHLPSAYKQSQMQQSPKRPQTQPVYLGESYEISRPVAPPPDYVPRKKLKDKSRLSLRTRRNTSSERKSRWSMATSDCECDRKFYTCLEKTDNLVSRQVGNLYFNILHRRCQAFDHPIIRCTTRQGILGWRCIEYEVDTTKPMELQMRDNPYFYIVL